MYIKFKWEVVTMFQTIMFVFSAVESQPEANHPVGAFYFSHATMVDMLSSRLSLTEDSFPPAADNYPQEKYRQFRTSHIIPFAGNILAVLYKSVAA